MTDFDTAAMLLDAAYAADEAHHLYFDENFPGWEVSEIDPEDRRDVDFWSVSTGNPFLDYPLADWEFELITYGVPA